MPISSLGRELCRQGLWFINLCISSFLKIPCKYWISVDGERKEEKAGDGRVLDFWASFQSADIQNC